MSTLPVGRLAPSPTGAQHIGNARTFLLAWLSIRSRGGRLILRIEDIDSPRVKPGAAAQALADLHWLGLDWDEGPDRPGFTAPYVQTQNLDTYQELLSRLQLVEAVYPCTCTRSDVAAAASAPHAGQEGPVYPGTCTTRLVAHAAQLLNENSSFVWRLRTSSKCRVMADGFAGEHTCHVKQELGDFVVARSDGTPSYQLAVVADDHRMRVTEVLRGDDLLPSAFRQLELYEAFGWSPPEFIHVPLVVGPDGRRLAKRHGDTRLAALREAGVRPEQLVGLLAWSCGLRPTKNAVSVRELLSDFDLTQMPQEPFVFDDSMWRQLISA